MLISRQFKVSAAIAALVVTGVVLNNALLDDRPNSASGATATGPIGADIRQANDDRAAGAVSAVTQGTLAVNSVHPLYRLASVTVSQAVDVVGARYDVPSTAEAVERAAILEGVETIKLSALRRGDTIQLALFDGKVVEARVNLSTQDGAKNWLVGGELVGTEKGTFSLGQTVGVVGIGGVIQINGSSVGYVIERAKNGMQYLFEKRSEHIACMEMPQVVVSRAVVRASKVKSTTSEASAVGTTVVQEQSSAVASEYLLSSRPTASAVIYLDFDGETVTDSSWNGGSTITATASGLTATQITEIWRRVSEDYKPFNIDVTTNRSRYDAATAGSRMRCIITQTNAWYGSAGGVAFIGSFATAGTAGTSATIPCWVFANLLQGNTKYIAEATAHEVGHTLGLSHDGLKNSSGATTTSYYAGHGSGETSWAPIMGSAYYNNVTQWSKGEYVNGLNTANNTENDLAIISSASNHTGYAADAVGATIATASPLVFTSATAVDTVGVIERTAEVDMYSFAASGGAVTFSLVRESGATVGTGDLDAQLRLLNSSGAVVATSNPTGSVSPSVTATVAAGTYYVEVKGVGEGVVSGTGYSDYASLGRYEITGTVSASAPVISSSLTATSVAGQAFSYQVIASGAVSYSASSLPANLSINTSTGVISGTIAPTVASGNYSVTIGATNSSGTTSATLVLTVQSAYQAWAQASALPSAAASAVVDSDGDGVVNLLEYAFALSPTSSDVSGLPQTSVAMVNGSPCLQITFVRPLDRPDLVYTVEVSSNMSTWTVGHKYGTSVTNGSGLPTQEISRTVLTATTEKIVIRDVSASTGAPHFIRVNVSTLW